MQKNKHTNAGVRPQETEMALHTSLKKLMDINFALDVSSDVVITDKDGKIIYANDKFCKIFQYSREELIGQTHRIVNSGYHSKDFFKGLWNTIKSGRIWKGEVRNKAKDGNLYWMDTTIVPLLDENNKPYQYVAIRNDITKRKQMEEILSELPGKFIHLQEIEKQKIFTEIHEDIAQSIASVRIFLQSSVAEGEKKTEGIKTSCKKVIEELGEVLEKIRNLAYRLLPSTLVSLGLMKSIRFLVQDFAKRESLKLKFVCDHVDGVIAQKDQIHLFRIIQEALTNIANHAKADAIEISIRKKKDVFKIVIQDNGKGFDAKQSRYGKGLFQGLGISSMAERTRLLKGRFDIISSFNKGTAVVLDIPIAKQKKRLSDRKQNV